MDEDEDEPVRPLRQTCRRLLRAPAVPSPALVLFGIVLFAAIFAPWLAPIDPNRLGHAPEVPAARRRRIRSAPTISAAACGRG